VGENGWGEIGVDGMLVFVPPFSGFCIILPNLPPLYLGCWEQPYFYHTQALMADAVHGLGDTAAEVVTALAYVEAARPPDKELQLDGNSMDSQHGFSS
jgi:hypothetical protein